MRSNRIAILGITAFTAAGVLALSLHPGIAEAKQASLTFNVPAHGFMLPDKTPVNMAITLRSTLTTQFENASTTALIKSAMKMSGAGLVIKLDSPAIDTDQLALTSIGVDQPAPAIGMGSANIPPGDAMAFKVGKIDTGQETLAQDFKLKSGDAMITHSGGFGVIAEDQVSLVTAKLNIGDRVNINHPVGLRFIL